jgi:hypothetical protein
LTGSPSPLSDAPRREREVWAPSICLDDQVPDLLERPRSKTGLPSLTRRPKRPFPFFFKRQSGQNARFFRNAASRFSSTLTIPASAEVWQRPCLSTRAFRIHQYARDCGIVTSNAFPCSSKVVTTTPRSGELNFGKLSKDFDQSLAKLKEYYGSLGFMALPDDDIMVAFVG